MLNSRQFATTVDNGFKVLLCFRAGEPALTNKELVLRTGLSKATISRLTYTLMLKGLLTCDEDGRRYRLGAGVFSLGYPLLANMTLRQIARPFMQQLAYESGGSVSLGSYHRGHMVYVETCRGHDVIAFRPDIGARLPLLVSAMGKAWLTQIDDTLGPSIVATLEQLHAQEDVHLCDARRFNDTWHLAKQEYAQHGYCVSRGQWLADVQAVAAPWVQSIEGEVLIFNCGVPVSRLSGRSIDEFGVKLVEMITLVKEAFDAREAH